MKYTQNIATFTEQNSEVLNKLPITTGIYEVIKSKNFAVSDNEEYAILQNIKHMDCIFLIHNLLFISMRLITT